MPDLGEASGRHKIGLKMQEQAAYDGIRRCAQRLRTLIAQELALWRPATLQFLAKLLLRRPQLDL